MKPTRRRPVPHVPHQLSPAQSPCLAKEYGASAKLAEGCARACWITGRCQGTAHQWHAGSQVFRAPVVEGHGGGAGPAYLAKTH